jgi:peptidyl-prolyl cis-trans isomerase SurA
MIKQWVLSLCGLWFFAASHGQPLDTVIAEINEGVITKRDLDRHVMEKKQELTARHIEIPSDNILRKQVLQHMIDVQLQLDLAKNNNIHLDEEELNEIIKGIALQNKLDVEQLKTELVKHDLSWERYRENLNKEIILTRLQQQALGNTIHISEKQVDDYLEEAIKQQHTLKKYHLQNIVVPLSEAPSAEEVNAAYLKAQNIMTLIRSGEDFSKLAISESSDEYALEGGDLGVRTLAELPDVLASQLKDVKVNEVKGPIRAPNGWQIIKVFGLDDSDLHHQIVKTHVKHILIKPGPQMTDAEAERMIQNLSRQIQDGKKFDTIAKHYSVDATTAVKGGDMGWVVSNELVPQFAEVMDKMAVNTISQPVKSPFGWHIIQVVERKAEDDSNAFQRQKVRNMLRQKRFEEAVVSWRQRLRTQAFINVLDKDLA